MVLTEEISISTIYYTIFFIKNLTKFYVSQKNNYFYTSLLSYVKFLDKLNPNYEVGMKYLQAIN